MTAMLTSDFGDNSNVSCPQHGVNRVIVNSISVHTTR